VTASGVVAALQDATALAFVAIGALTIRDWLATRDRGRMFLALAIGTLAVVAILGQLGKLLGGAFVVVTADITAVLFLGSGLALLLFRDSVIPLGRRTRRLVIAGVALTAAYEITIQSLGGSSRPGALQFIGLAAFLVVWCGCVGEPSVRLWLAASHRSAVQRKRMRALSVGYLGIIAILLAAVTTGSLAKEPIVQIGIALASLAVVPPLYAGFAPPLWLRRLWRQGEETEFHEATRDVVLFASDRDTLAGRALEWAVRLTGAEAGFITDDGSRILATREISIGEAELVHAKVRALNAQPVVALGGTPPRSAIVAPLPGGDSAIVLVSGPFTPVFGNDEESWLQHYAALLATGFDRVRLVEALEEANRDLRGSIAEVRGQTRQLKAANGELEAFSYTISHDLRAPLRAINGFTSILMKEYLQAIPTAAQHYLTRVRDNGEHMGHQLDDLLAFSRLGRQPLRTRPVNTRGVVDHALAQLTPLPEGRPPELVIGELPACESDPTLLEQVFVNLIDNAIKYSRKKDPSRIEVGVLHGDRLDEPATFFVRDNGIGFDMRYADKLFGVFQRLHSNDPDYEGTGVGLAIVRRIVERHGGRVWAEAKVGEGAAFYFTLQKGADAPELATAA